MDKWFFFADTALKNTGENWQSRALMKFVCEVDLLVEIMCFCVMSDNAVMRLRKGSHAESFYLPVVSGLYFQANT